MVKKILKENGKGKVLVVDGGGSLRRALVGDMVAMDFMKNEWEGIIGKFYFLFIFKVNGCIRDSGAINEFDFGIKVFFN